MCQAPTVPSGSTHPPAARWRRGGLDAAPQVERIFAAMDVDGNGTVDINEFIAACLGKQRVDESAIRAAFQRIDKQR